MSFQPDGLCQQERAPCCAHPSWAALEPSGERERGWEAPVSSRFQDATSRGEGLAISGGSGGFRLVVSEAEKRKERGEILHFQPSPASLPFPSQQQEGEKANNAQNPMRTRGDSSP